MPTSIQTSTATTSAAERAAANALASAAVVWRGEPIPVTEVPERIARLSGREERDRLLGGYREALAALDPVLAARLASWTESGDPVERAAAAGPDPRALAVDLERFLLHSETPYFAALRRNLAVIGIEQGDATVADLWHLLRGAAFAHWFGDRALASAVAATGRPLAPATDGGGWEAAEAALGGAAGDAEGEASGGAAVVSAAYRTLVGSPEWLGGELGMAAAEVPAFADFAAFVRLWRVRRDVALLQYELRLFDPGSDPDLARAYYAGIVGHVTGVIVPEEAYLVEVSRPFASVARLAESIAAAALVETLEAGHGSAWWRDAAVTARMAEIGRASSAADALARLGYDGADWRPLLRQIRTRLIGEMSGYGGPNITTRAGTRKV